METSLERMLAVLDVVGDAPASIAFDDILQRLGYTRSTLYRYLKILTDFGLLTSLPDLGYMLGPRITELDYKMRLHDTLLITSRPVMAQLVQSVPGIALLCRRYRTRVLCVHQERGTSAFHSHFERGLARPLLRGAASRIILAYLPGPSLARLHAADAAGFAAAGLGSTLAEIRAELRRIRLPGWDATEGQVTPGVTGIACAIFDGSGNVLGSLSLTIGRIRIPEAERRAIAEQVKFCAGIVNRAIARQASANPTM